MKINFLLFSLLLLGFQFCKKDNDRLVTGTVLEKKGCYDDSYLVAINNPDFNRHSFLRPTTISCACYSAANAAYIRLGSSFQVGNRIRFSYVSTEGSCLSWSEAPNHITVKNLARL